MRSRTILLLAQLFLLGFLGTAQAQVDWDRQLTLADLEVVYLDPPATVGALCPVYLTQWGSLGTGNGQFNEPTGLATDAAGNVYVTDADNDRIQKFDGAGNYLTQWGTFGSGNGQFSSPFGVGTDAAGNVYIADAGNNRIQKFTNTGTYITQWGSFGTGNGQFRTPNDVVTDAAGNVYVADRLNHRIQKFTSTGGYLTQWGTLGSGNGQFNVPIGVGMDAAGNVYVADTNNQRIQKFTNTGTYLIQWGSSGSGNGQFNLPTDVVTDADGDVFVADFNNHRIQKFTATGTYLCQWGSLGSGGGQFNTVYRVATAGGNVYASDVGNNRIQKFGTAPSHVEVTPHPVLFNLTDQTQDMSFILVVSVNGVPYDTTVVPAQMGPENPEMACYLSSPPCSGECGPGHNCNQYLPGGGCRCGGRLPIPSWLIPVQRGDLVAVAVHSHAGGVAEQFVDDDSASFHVGPFPDWDRQLTLADLDVVFTDPSHIEVTAHPRLFNFTSQPQDMSYILEISVNGSPVDATEVIVPDVPRPPSCSNDCSACLQPQRCYPVLPPPHQPWSQCGVCLDIAPPVTFGIDGTEEGDIVIVTMSASPGSVAEQFIDDDSAPFHVTAFGPTGIEIETVPPHGDVLLTVSPNPAFTDATVRLDLANSGPTRLGLYDVQGRLLRSLANGNLPLGLTEFRLDLTDAEGTALPSGVYFVRAKQASIEQIFRFIIVR